MYLNPNTKSSDLTNSDLDLNTLNFSDIRILSTLMGLWLLHIYTTYHKDFKNGDLPHRL